MSNNINLTADNAIGLTATTTIQGGNFTVNASNGGSVDIDADKNTNISATDTLTLSAGKTIALTTTASLDSSLLDNIGASGADGQVLTVSGTQVLWKTSPNQIANGTLVNNTLRWDGSAWVENPNLTAGATNTTIDVNNDIDLQADNNISLTATNTTIDVSNNINLTADNAIGLTATTTIQGGNFTVNASNGGSVDIDADKNTNISATDTLTLSAGKTIALTTTASINKALLDKDKRPGSAGQILSSTGTQTTWISIPRATVTETTTDYMASINDGTIVVRPSNAVTITLPTPAPEDVGKTLTVKRGNVYTINNTTGNPQNPLTVVSAGGSTIDGTTTLNLNLSYQGFTLQALSSGNWSIIQRF